MLVSDGGFLDCFVGCFSNMSNRHEKSLSLMLTNSVKHRWKGSIAMWGFCYSGDILRYFRDFQKKIGDIFGIFRKHWDIFGIFEKFWNISGISLTFWDIFRDFQKLGDIFGIFKKFLDIFGIFRKFWDISRISMKFGHIFWDISKITGDLLRGFRDFPRNSTYFRDSESIWSNTPNKLIISRSIQVHTTKTKSLIPVQTTSHHHTHCTRTTIASRNTMQRSVTIQPCPAISKTQPRVHHGVV